MYPLLLKPVCKEILWGGTRLKTDYGIESCGSNIAESWMLTCRPDGDNEILNGVYAGKTLGQLFENGILAMGTAFAGGDFPLLIKLIDAKNDLSVQVHPDDAYAAAHEKSRGKTESWYILDAEPKAELIYGFKNEITKECFKNSIADNRLLDYVNRVEVKKSDFFYIPAGTLHAIGSGILLAEVQQNCNTTYRVYDYNRLENGVPRQLHIEKAVDVTDTKPPETSFTAKNYVDACAHITPLCRCPFFSVNTLEISGAYSLPVSNESFACAVVLSGSGTVTADGVSVPVKKGSGIFLGADSKNVIADGTMTILYTTQ